jgi:AcrR family transcriptional regulator
VRILEAMIQVAGEHGAQSATITGVTGAAGVSSGTFYELFADRGECLLAAFEHAVALAREHAGAAYISEARWIDRIRAGLFSLLELFGRDPALARLCLIESAAAGTPALAYRAKVLAQLAGLLDDARTAARRQPPPLTAEGVVGGTLAVIQTRLLERDRGALTELINPLMSFIAFPYLGGGAARIELSRAISAPEGFLRRQTALNASSGPGMRLSYRTMSVLAAIAGEAGLSNREVSVRAGVIDQGQISKLLARLAREGLIEATDKRHAQPNANAWRLTPRGSDLEWAITHPSVPDGCAQGSGSTGNRGRADGHV